MILSGLEIERRMGSDIVIEPYDRKLLNPNSYNLRLSDELLIYKNHELDMARPNDFERSTIPAEGLLLQPNKLYLGLVGKDRDGVHPSANPFTANFVCPENQKWNRHRYE